MHFSSVFTREDTCSIPVPETIEQISMPLLHAFNMSLQEGIVPLEWKGANIVPLFKKKVKETSL